MTTKVIVLPAREPERKPSKLTGAEIEKGQFFLAGRGEALYLRTATRIVAVATGEDYPLNEEIWHYQPLSAVTIELTGKG